MHFLLLLNNTHDFIVHFCSEWYPDIFNPYNKFHTF